MGFDYICAFSYKGTERQSQFFFFKIEIRQNEIKLKIIHQTKLTYIWLIIFRRDILETCISNNIIFNQNSQILKLLIDNKYYSWD